MTEDDLPKPLSRAFKAVETFDIPSPSEAGQCFYRGEWYRNGAHVEIDGVPKQCIAGQWKTGYFNAEDVETPPDPQP